MHKARDLKREDIEFLNNLQFKMNTQENMGNISPRFWVVMEKHREWGIEDGYQDGTCITDCEGSEYHGSKLEIIEKLIEEGCEIGDYRVIEFDAIWLEYEDITIHDLEDLVGYMNENFNKEFTISNYRNTNRIVPDTMFLTLDECKKHIKSNHYHYNNGKPYCMTAWRSPEVSKLYEILENVVWEQLRVEEK